MTTPMWHAIDVYAVVKELQADLHQGLAPAEAASRLSRYGPNELMHEEKASPWTLFFNQFKNVLIVILIVATLLSAAVGEYADAAIILVIIVVLRGARIRAGVPRGTGPRRAEGHVDPDDHRVEFAFLADYHFRQKGTRDRLERAARRFHLSDRVAGCP